jgi:hypothetical protein
MTQPFWVRKCQNCIQNISLIVSKLPVLQRDIRKLPEPAIGSHRRKRIPNESINDPQKRESTSLSGDNTSGEQTGSSTLIGQSSTASYPVTLSDVQLKEAPKSKRTVRYLDDPVSPREQRTTSTTRYWNEYDYPGDGDGSGTSDEGYYIYVDPNEKIQWPGAGLLQRLKALFKGRKPATEKDDEESAALLPDPALPPTAKQGGRQPQSPTSPTSASSLDDASSSNSETDTTGPGAHTLNRWGQRQRQRHPDTTAYGTVSQNTALAAPPPYARRPSLRLSTVSLCASLALLITITVLAATGRHRQQGEVDAGIMFGVAASLAFALVGMLAAVAGARVVPGDYTWVRWSLIGGCFGGVCVGCGVLLGWVLGSFG